MVLVYMVNQNTMRKCKRAKITDLHPEIKKNNPPPFNSPYLILVNGILYIHYTHLLTFIVRHLLKFEG